MSRHSAKLEAKVELLEAENTRLREQLEKLQMALIHRVSPQAYFDMTLPKEAVNDTDIAKNLAERNYLKRYSEEIEKPLFSNVQELIESMEMGEPQVATRSLHNNHES